MGVHAEAGRDRLLHDPREGRRRRRHLARQHLSRAPPATSRRTSTRSRSSRTPTGRARSRRSRRSRPTSSTAPTSTTSRAHIRFGAEVTGAEFDEAQRHVDGAHRTAASRCVRARSCSATARSAFPSLPRHPGARRVRAARVFHSARWDHDYDLAGKRVAVIGTGASAIQFVPQIAPTVGKLHLFQRTPPWILPKPDRPMTRREKRLFRAVPLAPLASPRVASTGSTRLRVARLRRRPAAS